MAQSGSCPDLAAIVAGSVCATFVVCTLVFGVILYVTWRRLNRAKLKYAVSGKRNGVDRQYSMAGSTTEAGLHNTAYVVDNTDSNDVIMMMATKGDSERRLSTARRRVVPSIYKHLDNIEVNLIGKEVSGLGFDVHGNPRDGISISSISDRGAARETNLMKVGDKVLSLTICFDNMVYEDALTLLSYASPYPITLLLGRKRKEKNRENGTLKSNSGTAKRKQKPATDSDSGTASDARSPDLSMSHDPSPDLSLSCKLSSDLSSESPQKTNSLVAPGQDADDIHVPYTDNESNTDDDTYKRAPSHLPQTIKSLVESKTASRQAVEVIEGHTRNQVLSPTSLESDQGIELTFGAQSALELILSQQPAEVNNPS